MDEAAIVDWALRNSFVAVSEKRYALKSGTSQVCIELKRISLVIFRTAPGKAPSVATRLYKDLERLDGTFLQG